MTKLKQTIGWILIAVGVAAILWGAWDSYQIFTAKKEAPQIFKIAAVQNQTTGNTNTSNKNLTAEQIQEQLQQQMQQAVKDSFSQMLPLDSMPKIFNLLTWSIFMGILIFAGGKISGIGIRLLGSGKDND